MTRRPETLDELRVGDGSVGVAHLWLSCLSSAAAGAALVVLVVAATDGAWVAALFASAGVALGTISGPVMGSRYLTQKFRSAARIRAALEGSEG